MGGKRLLTCFIIICAIGLVCTTGYGHCSESALYVDKEGHYLLAPPLGWVSKNFPPDRAWRRISFYDPTFRNVNLLIISGPVSNGYTLENLLSENQEKMRRFKQQYPSGHFAIRKDRVAGMDVLVFDMGIPPRLRQRIITLVQGQTLYSLTFMAENERQFLKNEATFQDVMDSFVPLGTDVVSSGKDAEKALLDRYKMLAELNVKWGERERARCYVKKGLEIFPEDKTLLNLQASLDG